MTRARVGRALARGLLFGLTAVLVVIAALLTWPWAAGPSADEQRLGDLQRLSHAIEAFRLKQHVLPAALARLPVEPAAPVHAFDPVTSRPYEYRPLGPLAYELCARFDAASGGERRDFWWHDAGRFCFALETREGPKPPGASSGIGGRSQPTAGPGAEATADPAADPAPDPAAAPAAEPAPVPAAEPPAAPAGSPAARPAAPPP